jgi:ribosomal-protein-alanine N-acetyltransferase
MAAAPTLALRDARVADLDALLALEAQFPGDRLSPRQMRRHLSNPRARLRVAVRDAQVCGYALVFLRAGSATARLYSIAVAASARGLGLGARLLADAERAARKAGKTALRLEVRDDNAVAVALYRGRGYRRVATLRGYYEDGGDGTRYEKALTAG